MGSQGNQALTLDDFLALCEAAPEGVRYECVEGNPVMMSAPTGLHQYAVTRLLVALDAAAGPQGLWALTAPLDWVLWEVPQLTVRQPDLVVVEPEQGRGARLSSPPILAVEVLSPTTRATDLHAKRNEYARAGTPHYWVVDLDVPSIEAFVLLGKRYYPSGTVKGDDPLTVTDPLALTITPSHLVG